MVWFGLVTLRVLHSIVLLLIDGAAIVKTDFISRARQRLNRAISRLVHKIKIARNEILSNFGFISEVDPMHRLGARGDYPKLAPPHPLPPPPVTPSLIKLALRQLKMTGT